MRVLSLDNARAQDPYVVGAKAARLARAKALGFQVPDSLVLPCSASEPVLAAAAREIPTHGVHYGRFAVMASGGSGLTDLPYSVSSLGDRMAVRSSCPDEDSPGTAGAYSTYLGIAPDDLVTAVLGVWSSALRRDGEPPAENAGAPNGQSVPSMAVLIQRELVPDLAGTAELGTNGDVRVTAIRGSAEPLTGGWQRGIDATVSAGGRITGADALAVAGEAVLTEVAALSRGIGSALGDTLVEWAYADGDLWLLQSRLSAYSVAAQAGPVPDAVTAHVPFVLDPRLVVNSIRRVGELAERTVLPWVVACGDLEFSVDLPSPRSAHDPERLWARFVDLSDELFHSVWRAAVTPAEVVDRLAHAVDDGGAALQELGTPVKPDAGAVAEFGRLACMLMAHLRATGSIVTEADFWALPANVDSLAIPVNGRGGARRAAMRWEPLLCSAVIAGGETRAGVGVSVGMGGGPATLVDVSGFASRIEADGLAARSVLVAARPLPKYAPLLMGAAGLVTAGGSAAAHLVEVARSLGVPVVIGCDIERLADGASYIAVDGSTGSVHVVSLTTREERSWDSWTARSRW